MNIEQQERLFKSETGDGLLHKLSNELVFVILFISRDYILRFADGFAPLVRTWSQIFPELVEQKTGSHRSVIVLTQKRAARLHGCLQYFVTRLQRLPSTLTLSLRVFLSSHFF